MPVASKGSGTKLTYSKYYMPASHGGLFQRLGDAVQRCPDGVLANAAAARGFGEELRLARGALLESDQASGDPGDQGGCIAVSEDDPLKRSTMTGKVDLPR